MQIPPGHTPATVHAAIERSLDLLAARFSFGCYEIEDMRQEGYVLALELLASGKYDCKRPLGGFIYSHIRKRFINLKRDKLHRSDAPCKDCHEGFHCTGTRNPCDRYANWAKRNDAKSALMSVREEDGPGASESDPVGDDVESREVNAIIDAGLSADLRKDWLRMKAGVRLEPARRRELEEALREILLCDPREDDCDE